MTVVRCSPIAVYKRYSKYTGRHDHCEKSSELDYHVLEKLLSKIMSKYIFSVNQALL